MHLTEYSFDSLAREYRRHFFNTLPGPRNALLLGTRGHRGVENLAVFSSVVHLGASPFLLGFVLRPLTVPRHTYHHLLATGWFTVNTIQPGFLHAAHQSSANYPTEVSEFTAVGLTPEYSKECKAPYVAESQVRIGLTLEETHDIAANGTLFVVGRVREIFVPDAAVAETGHVDHHGLGTMTVTGLDSYAPTLPAERLPYARPPRDQ